MKYPIFKEDAIAFDIETRDPYLVGKGKRPSLGSGAHRHYIEGSEEEYILGVSFSDSKNDYYFEACPDLFRWMKSIQTDHLWIAHRTTYDMSWLYYEEFRPKRLADTIGLVRLLHEDRMKYNLDSCAKDFLKKGKNEDEIQQFCDDHNLKGKPQNHLYLMPPDLVGRYAKIDTRRCYDLYQLLIPEIEEQNLTYIWQIEMDLLPILVRINNKGLRINNDHREKQIDLALIEEKRLSDKIYKIAGCEFNVGSGKQKKEIFDKLGLHYEINEPTEKMVKKANEKGLPYPVGNPSFKGDDLLPYGVEPDENYLPHLIVIFSKIQKLRRDFLDKLELFMVKGRIHPTINPYGTKTGRPTASAPNIFQIPKKGRGKEICRPLFLPEKGEIFVSADYNSEEFRVFAHYARGEGADEYRRLYNETDDFDMHNHNAEIAKCERVKAKSIGLGILFGMGKRKLAITLNLKGQEGAMLLKHFNMVNPSFMRTAKDAQAYAEKFKFIKTISGRRRRFPRGEGAYKALNFLTQGNSADIAKISIVEAEKAGLWEKMNFLLFLYDEYDISMKAKNKKYLDQFIKIAENAIKLNVRMKLDVEKGPDWGNLKPW